MTDAERAIASIRRTELQAAQRVEAARARAEEIRSEARAEARRLHRDAEARGRIRAQERLAEAHRAAEEDAEKIREIGLRDAAVLGAQPAGRMGELVEALLDAVLPSPAEGVE